MAFDYVEIAEEGRFLPWGRVAAEKVDEMEHWIANADAMVITGSSISHKTDKTYDEVVAAIESGRNVVFKEEGGNTYYPMIGYDNYSVQFGKIRIANPNRWLAMYQLSKSGNYLSVESCYYLPAVGSINNGSELVVSEGAWIGQQKKFVVTLTPTSPDYSGTMDKKVSEINAAFEAGQKIVFRIVFSADEHMDVDCTAIYTDSNTYPSFNAFIVSETNDALISAYTVTTNNGDKTTYSTVIYTLTRLSSES